MSMGLGIIFDLMVVGCALLRKWLGSAVNKGAIAKKKPLAHPPNQALFIGFGWVTVLETLLKCCQCALLTDSRLQSERG